MKSKITILLKKYSPLFAVIAGFLFIFLIKAGLDYTSSDPFCDACHVHPHSTKTWKQSTHKDTKSGTVVHCVDCHLPPNGIAYLTEKMKSGALQMVTIEAKNKKIIITGTGAYALLASVIKVECKNITEDMQCVTRSIEAIVSDRK